MTTTVTSPLLLPALALATSRFRFRVFPCWAFGDGKDGRPKAKAPMVPGGLSSATTDLAVITAWWTRWPDALIGAVVPDHLIVVDVDPWHGGTTATLEQEAGRLTPTLTCRSGRGDGGVHLYYEPPPGVNLTGTRLPQGVDLRLGGRAYCIVPPSLHPVSGKPYAWEPRPVAPCPPGLTDLLRTTSTTSTWAMKTWPTTTSVSPKRISYWLHRVATAAEGRRNTDLYWIANEARRNNVLDELEPQLIDAARAAGLDDLEIHNTITSARRQTS